MSKLQERISEIEKKKRKTTIKYLIAGIVILGAFSFFYINSLFKQINDKEKLIQKTSQLQFYGEDIKSGEVKDKKYNEQLLQLKNALEFLRTTTTDPFTKNGIDSILEKVNIIYRINSDTITIQYDKRIADGDMVTKAIQSMNHTAFRLEETLVKNDSSRLKVNTVYYGKSINRNILSTLVQKIQEHNIDIVDVKPFRNKTYEWDGVVKIFYTEPPSELNKDSSLTALTPLVSPNANFDIRFYSYRPDKKTKVVLQKTLKDESYHVSIFPDWKTKPSFFSKESTILYYDDHTKEKAIELANTLNEKLDYKVNFKASKGYGYGIVDEEKDNLFVIHYVGSK